MLMAAREGITLQQQEAAIRLASFRNKPAELVQPRKPLTANLVVGSQVGMSLGCHLNATETSTKNTAAHIVEAQTRVKP